jgi:DUF4097 and DUF4098 domain-containing protein YvlB
MKNAPLLHRSAFLFIVIALAATSVLAQKTAERGYNREFCSNNNWSSGNQFSASDLRQMTLPATGSLAVDGGQNGGIRVKGENRSDIQVRACVQAWGASDEAAKALAASIRISESPVLKADSAIGDSHWSVSYEVLVPRNTDLKLNAHNGGISIESVEGRLEFETTNGRVGLRDVSGDVKGRTTNGGVMVSLSGGSWKGNGLDVQTTNGGVSLNIPESYAAHVETGTVNGGFTSDIAALNVERNDRDRSRASRVTADLNGGGAPIRVITTNGGIKISSSDKY